MLLEAEGNIVDDVTRELPTGPAQSETRSMRENSLHGTREVPQAPGDGEAGRSGKVDDQKPDMHACGKLDGCVVPKKPLNKGGGDLPAEVVEGRQPTDGNTRQTATPRTQRRTSVSIGLERVRGVVKASTPNTRGRSRMR